MLAAMRAAPDDAFHVGCRAGLGRTGMALAMAGVIYLGMIPFSVRSYLRLKREAESMIEPVVVSDTGRSA
jgi:protein-tyrosine phosphatase